MSTSDTDTPSPPREAVFKAFVINLILLPGGLLVVFYGISLVTDVAFDILIFILTAVALMVLLSGRGWGQRAAASSRRGVLIQRADQVYIKDMSDGRGMEFTTVGRLALVILAATVIGWVILLASYLGFLPPL